MDHRIRATNQAHGTLGRRELLLAGGALGLTAAAAGFSPAKAWSAPAFGGDPFSLGVASGDPWSDSVVLWTRLAPDPLALDGTGGMPPARWPSAGSWRPTNGSDTSSEVE